MESDFENKDFQYDASLLCMTRQDTRGTGGTDGHRRGSAEPEQLSAKPSVTLSSISQAGKARARANITNTAQAMEERLLMEEKHKILTEVAQARSNIIKMNDDFCYGELYTPFGQRGLRYPSSSNALAKRREDEDCWNEDKLKERTRDTRHRLDDLISEEHEKLRHNPIVLESVDVGRAEGHCSLLNAIRVLPQHSKVMAAKKEIIHQQSLSHSKVMKSKAREEAAAAAAAAAALTNLQPAASTSNLKSRGQSSAALVASHSAPSLSARPVSLSLSDRLDALHELLNERKAF